MKTSVKKTIASVLGAAALGLTAIHPAEAARIVGRWDPVFGGIFPNLGWEATAQIDVPDACLAQADGTYVVSAGPCFGFGFASVLVDFYNAADPLQTSLAQFSTTLDPLSITNVTIDDNMLVGLNAGPFDFFTPPADGPGSIWGNGVYSFSLLIQDVDVLDDGNVTSRAQLAYNDLTKSTSPWCWATPTGYPPAPPPPTRCGISGFSDPGVFTRVPEPHGIALLLAGFAALGFASRHRAQA